MRQVLLLALALGGALALAAPTTITSDEIEKMLADDPTIRTGEDLLSKLPDDLRTNPVLMYRTQSLQEASATHPRVILFGYESGPYYTKGDNKLFLAFNGDPKQKNYQSFELIQYRAKTNRFEFAKIQFSDRKRPLFVKSPPECIRCHDYPGHPNWTPYAFWPGAFPSSDGFAQTSEKETKAYQEFYDSYRKQGRYQYLHLQSVAELTPSTENPTKRISSLLQDLSDETLPDLVVHTRNYGAYRHLLAAAVMGCENVESFVPPALLKRFAGRHDEVVKKTVAEQREAYRLRVVDFGKLIESNVDFYVNDDGINFSAPETPVAGALRWVMERDGASIAPWFFSFSRTSWEGMRSRSFSGLGYTLASRSGQYTASYCADLKKDSLQALEELMTTDKDPLSTGLKESTIVGDRNAEAAVLSDQDVTTAQEILESSCLKCHSHPEVAPVFEVGDLGKFRAQLKAPPVGKTSLQPTLYEEWLDRLRVDGDRRMPPDHALSARQVQALENYLNEVLR